MFAVLDMRSPAMDRKGLSSMAVNWPIAFFQAAGRYSSICPFGALQAYLVLGVVANGCRVDDLAP